MIRRSERCLLLWVAATAVGASLGGAGVGLMVAGNLEYVVARWEGAARGELEPVEAAVPSTAWSASAHGLSGDLRLAVEVVLCVLWAIVSIGGALWMLRSVRQRRAVEAIRAMGGQVTYGDRLLTAWLRAGWVVDLFARVVSVKLERQPVGDEAAVPMSRLPHVRRLWLAGTGLGDEGLFHLRGLKRLESLDLTDTAVTDAGLRHLSRLARLRRLWLEGTAVTEAGLEELEGLPNLMVVEAGVHRDVVAAGGKEVGCAAGNARCKHRG